MLKKTPKQLLFSKTAAPSPSLRRAATEAPRRPRMLPPKRLRPDQELGLNDAGNERRELFDRAPERQVRLEPLVREWLPDLQVLGRSRTSIDWYAQTMRWFLAHGEARTLDQLTGFELKRFLAEQQSCGLSDNSVRGDFQTIKAMATAMRALFRNGKRRSRLGESAPASDGWGRYLTPSGEVFVDLEWDRGTESLRRLEQKVRSYIGYFKNRQRGAISRALRAAAPGPREGCAREDRARTTDLRALLLPLPGDEPSPPGEVGAAGRDLALCQAAQGARG